MDTKLYRFVRNTRSSKLSGLPSTSTVRESCPDRCGLKNNGCYAENFPGVVQWKRIPENGCTLPELRQHLKGLPARVRVRLNTSGDFLQTPAGDVDLEHVSAIADGGRRTRMLAYTHHDPVSQQGLWKNFIAPNFVIRASCDSTTAVDTLPGWMPAAVVVDSAHPKDTTTPGGRRVVVCPAQSVGGSVSCATCDLCWREDPEIVIGFRAHGTRYRLIDATLVEDRLPDHE